MKRGGPLKRTTRLSRGTKRLRRGVLNWSAENTRTAARRPLVSKPKPVTPEERRARHLVAQRSNGACEGCDRARAAHWAHRVAEGQGGTWCACNGLHLCAPCHTGWAHLNPDAAKAAGWIVLPGADPKTIPVRHALHGLVLLDCNGGFTTYSEEAA